MSEPIFCVGDRVRITRDPPDDKFVCPDQRFYFLPEMRIHCGQEFEITEIVGGMASYNEPAYRGAFSRWYWQEAWLEPIAPELDVWVDELQLEDP